MKDKITCIITDDEPLARKGLKGYVERTGFLELKGICEDAFQLSEALQISPVDLLFLDIQMPEITGIEFLKTLRNPPKVIFTTAFDQYAIEGFDYDVVDYLLKPISYERFYKGALKANAYFNPQYQRDTDIDSIFLKAGGKLEKISLSEVLFIEGMENYVAIHLTNKKIITHTTIKSLLEKLPAKNFVQTHRSFIVRMDKVESVDRFTLNIKEYRIPVSRSFIALVRNSIK